MRGPLFVKPLRSKWSFSVSAGVSVASLFFETWLMIWTAANLVSFREDDDLSVWVRLRADELTEDATTVGFYGELVEAAKPYGGVEGYVRNKLKDVPR